MPTDWDVVRTMERFGGSFVRALAQCCHRADPQNLAKIKACWPEQWAKYSDMAAIVQRQDAERNAEATREANG